VQEGNGDEEIIAEKDCEDCESGRATTIAMALMVMSPVTANAKKKEKKYLPDFVRKAQAVLVVILPDAGEPLDDPLANRKAQEEVEKAFMKWRRYRLAVDASTADLVIGVRKGTGRTASPTIDGGPIDTRPAKIEATDNQIRIAAQQGHPPDVTQDGTATGTNGPNDRAHTGMEVGATDDTFEVFQGVVPYPVDNAPVWKYVAKDGRQRHRNSNNRSRRKTREAPARFSERTCPSDG
jgi:hypothetical protein